MVASFSKMATLHHPGTVRRQGQGPRTSPCQALQNCYTSRAFLMELKQDMTGSDGPREDGSWWGRCKTYSTS